MGPKAPLHCFAFFLLFLHLTSGSGIDKMRLPSKPIKQSRKFDVQESHMPFLYSDATTVRDDTTPTYFSPTDGTPVVNPTPPTTITSPTITSPTITPTMPTPTTTTPTTPTTPATPTITPITTPTTSPGTQTPSSGGSWCVASSSASSTALQVALDYACGYGGADCSAIQPGASCYNPDTIKDHASYAFNQYYQKNPGPTSCSFGGTAQITTTDPSSGSCRYASSSSTASTTTPPTPTTPTTTPMTPLTQSPPSPPSPTITTTPIGGSTVYGGEPVGSPNTAASMDQNSVLLLATTIMLMYVLLGVHP